MSRERNIRWIAMAAIAFGALTIVSGGRALFGDVGARAQLGNVVPFVLWFNFAVAMMSARALPGGAPRR